ncbi:hypothetical protein EIP91_000144 [Steccherinum ochraceum]|uniref:ABM domain-containing protein n=1 Tax=Steccherinum ochraceum TaxID=92696 RepID=A0A4R0RV13_9APHY|nr:hypothetical protein EIP91_000144 [Steccherinum ochraceum]
MSTPSLGLFVPLVAKPDQTAAVEQFLLAGHTLVQNEPETLQWFAIKYDAPESNPTKTIDTHFLIFDTFAGESGRQAHLEGPIAQALMANRPTLLVEGDEGVAIKKVEVVASKVSKSSGVPASDVKQGLPVGFRVLLTAKADKVDEVKNFLKATGAKLQTESSGPNVWFSFQFPGTSQFGIIGLFVSEAERQERSSSEFATQMREKATELLEGPPDVYAISVVAARF